MKDIINLTEILPLIICVFFFKKLNTNTFKVFFVYATTSIIFLGLSLIALEYFHSFYFHMSLIKIFLILEFILISLFYITVFKSKKVNTLLSYSSIIFTIFCIARFVKSSKTEFDFIPLVLECLFFTVIILYFFYEKLRYSFNIPIYNLPSFWISIAFLIYFSGNFSLFLFSKAMQNEAGFGEQYRLIYGIITIIKNILLCTALIINKNLIVIKINPSVIPNLNIEDFKTVQ